MLLLEPRTGGLLVPRSFSLASLLALAVSAFVSLTALVLGEVSALEETLLVVLPVLRAAAEGETRTGQRTMGFVVVVTRPTAEVLLVATAELAGALP